MTRSVAYSSPLGRLVITETDGAISRLEWRGAEVECEPSALLDEACRQLAEYFNRQREAFDLPVAFAPGLTGAVMRAMCAIPFGDTRTYGDLAKELGVPAQAVGQACGANPVPVIVPCHRVLGASGLGGFSAPGGVETKVALLKHEGAASLLI
ncbi:Methylated-DNA--protein-cysteine methyltransferase, constitutive [Defluviimonas aquaemixtae]|uniref:methylated-DNA--[protein]-cysteine S-methyltransferase n=1 Tax=Albidovulum aquaemixtae TaxID=1542388 RepID=A0A2R8B2U6_9RHOB|nr:methylated-DNA--[protein]-cysteine S-methyltransferase [Defluviimonas aquaemixtae]SPH16870.1 Methylated-DNA--protein-cysteine methyltransferase, constitutive [Defluviimonas aquaemixtae]